MTSVLVAAQSPVVRAGLASLVAASPSFSLAGGGGVAILGLSEQIDDTQPDVVLVDLNGQNEGFFNNFFTAEIGRRSDLPAFVVLIDDIQERMIIDALRAGVRAILPDGSSTEEIVAAVAAAAEGLVTLRPDTLELLISPTKTARGLPLNGQEPLTPRESEVLMMMAEGLANKTIAFKLGISEHTVKFHVGSIFGKLGVSSRTEAVALGIRQGLIMI